MPQPRDTTPARPRRSSGARPTDDDLLDVARSVFAERGFAPASMEAIAEQADTTKPTLYAHFGSKEGMYRAVIRREVVLVEAALFAVYESVRDASARNQMEEGFAAIMNYARVNREGGRLLFGADGPGHAEVVVALVARLTKRVSYNLEAFLMSRGRTPSPILPIVARSMVWAAVTAVQSADLDDDDDCARKIELAATFSRGGLNALAGALVTEPPAAAARDGRRPRSQRTR